MQRIVNNAGKLNMGKSAYAVFALFATTTISLPAQTFTTLYSFSGTDAANPYLAALVQGTDGNFYGTTTAGGASGLGTVFNITPAGALTTLFNFDFTDGANPYAGLVEGPGGVFYGTTYGAE